MANRSKPRAPRRSRNAGNADMHLLSAAKLRDASSSASPSPSSISARTRCVSWPMRASRGRRRRSTTRRSFAASAVMWRPPGASTTRRRTRALRALARFRVLCETMNVSRRLRARDRGRARCHERPGFLRRPRRRPAASRSPSLGRRGSASSPRSASSSGFHAPDGIVGDMGGGSLELVDVKARERRAGRSPCRSAALRCRTSAAAR